MFIRCGDVSNSLHRNFLSSDNSASPFLVFTKLFLSIFSLRLTTSFPATHPINYQSGMEISCPPYLIFWQVSRPIKTQQNFCISNENFGDESWRQRRTHANAQHVSRKNGSELSDKSQVKNSRCRFRCNSSVLGLFCGVRSYDLTLSKGIYYCQAQSAPSER